MRKQCTVAVNLHNVPALWAIFSLSGFELIKKCWIRKFCLKKRRSSKFWGNPLWSIDLNITTSQYDDKLSRRLATNPFPPSGHSIGFADRILFDFYCPQHPPKCPSQNIHHAQPPPPLFTRFLLPQQIQRNATAGGVSYSRELVLWPFLFRAAVGRWVFFPMGAHNRECSTVRPVSSTTDTNWHTNKPKAELAACWEREVGGEGGEGVPGQGLPTILPQGSNDQSRKSGIVHTPFSIAANWFSISEGGLGKI